MTLIQPPSHLQNGSHSARSDRMTIGALWAPGSGAQSVRGGVRNAASGLEFAATAANTATVSIGPGTAIIAASNGGAYACHNDAAVTRTVGAAHPTLPRIDLVVARVNDAESGSGSDDWDLQIIPGTPASSPVPPALPALSIPLHEILVRAGSSTIVAQADITDRRGLRMVANGGVIPASSTTLPTGAAIGQASWARDTNALHVWNGTEHRRVDTVPAGDTGAWTVYTPALTSDVASPAPTIGAGGQRHGRWTRIGKTVTAIGHIIFGSGAVQPAAGLQVSLPLPVAAMPLDLVMGLAHYTRSPTPNLLTGIAAAAPGTSVMRFRLPSFSTIGDANVLSQGTLPLPAGTGDVLRWSITYETV